MALHGFVAAVRFIRKAPPGPKWLHWAMIVAGSVLITVISVALVERIGFWWSLAPTMGCAMGYFTLCAAALSRLYPGEMLVMEDENHADKGAGTER